MAMLRIFLNQKGLIEEDLLCFCLAYAMLIGIFTGIAFVPVKTGDFVHEHSLCILSIYTIVVSARRMCRRRRRIGREWCASFVSKPYGAANPTY